MIARLLLHRAAVLGVFFGFAGSAAVVAWGAPSLLTLQANFQVTANGADLDRHGAARLVLADGRGLEAEQICVGPCDDLVLRTLLGESGPRLRVLAQDGHEIASGGAYVSGGDAFTELEIRGGQRLSIEGESTITPPFGG
ncbi:hypothetical protein ACO2Q0_03030 [Phenylobacterium sp. VNQ135]|uniref:hypothetical protein n=1 Tax=Phenylobacterium sp. VNQ135 TaxID=3400922 RepID=UPI003C0F1E2F